MAVLGVIAGASVPQETWLFLVQHLAWPITALIGLFVMRPVLNNLFQALATLKKLIDNPESLLPIAEQMERLRQSTEQVTEKLAELKGGQEIAIAKRTEPLVQPTKAEVDEQWNTVIKSWTELRDAIATHAKRNDVAVRLHGQVGVVATMNELTAKNAVNATVAADIIDLSGKWQWMFRTTTPREDFLTPEFVSKFRETCADAKKRLLAGTA